MSEEQTKTSPKSERNTPVTLSASPIAYPLIAVVWVFLVAYELALAGLSAGLLAVALRGSLGGLVVVHLPWLRVVLAAAGAVLLYRLIDRLPEWFRFQKPSVETDRAAMAAYPHEKRRGQFLLAAGVALVLLAGTHDDFGTAVQIDPIVTGILGIGGAMIALGGWIAQKSPAAALAARRIAGGAYVGGRGIVKSSVETGTTVNESPRVKLRVLVEVSGKKPYEAEWEGLVPRLRFGLVRPGESLSLKVDLEDPMQFKIDWDAPRSSA